jgi:hypothetical protein
MCAHIPLSAYPQYLMANAFGLGFPLRGGAVHVASPVAAYAPKIVLNYWQRWRAHDGARSALDVAQLVVGFLARLNTHYTSAGSCSLRCRTARFMRLHVCVYERTQSCSVAVQLSSGEPLGTDAGMGITYPDHEYKTVVGVNFSLSYPGNSGDTAGQLYAADRIFDVGCLDLLRPPDMTDQGPLDLPPPSIGVVVFPSPEHDGALPPVSWGAVGVMNSTSPVHPDGLHGPLLV